jgi:hypothetical protein
MNLKDKLDIIRNDLNKINNSHKELLLKGLDIKLERVGKKYNQTIIDNCKYILSRNNYKVMMSINRYNRRKEKKNEEKLKYRFINDN